MTTTRSAKEQRLVDVVGDEPVVTGSASQICCNSMFRRRRLTASSAPNGSSRRQPSA